MSSGSPVRVENVIGLQATLDYILARLGGVGGAITLTGDVTGSGVSPVATSISATGVAPGSYGDATNVAQIVVGADGRIVSATDVAISITSGINQLTGDVTAGPGTGSQAATIAAQAVTYAKIQNESDNTLLGRSAGSAGSPMEIAIGSGLSLAAGTLTASGSGGITELTGDVTAGPGSGSQAATLANSGVSAASYGSATQVATFTVDAKGRLTAASNTTIQVSIGNIESAILARLNLTIL